MRRDENMVAPWAYRLLAIQSCMKVQAGLVGCPFELGTAMNSRAAPAAR